jgi:hypothetical protein
MNMIRTPYQQQQAVQTPAVAGGARKPTRGRGYTERYASIITQPCANSSSTVFGKEFPLGEGWYKANVRFNLVFVVGTGTTPITEGELLYIKNVQLRTDRGEIICNLPGRALYKIATYKTGQAPFKDAIAASNGTYTVTLPIYFAENRTMDMLRMQDTVLNTARYNSLILTVTLGSVSDLLTTPGTSTVTTNMDFEIERSFGPLPPQAFPLYHISYDIRPPVDANTTTSIDIERSADMAIKRIYVHSSTSGTAGVPFSGVNADTIQNQVTLKDQNRFIEFLRFHAMILNQNKCDAQLESKITGFEAFDFVADGSIVAALATAEKSVLQYTWTNQAGVVANSIVTLAEEMVRTLK